MADLFYNPRIIYLVSGSGATPVEQMNDCLRQLAGELEQKRIERDRVIKQTVFFEAGTAHEYSLKRGIIERALKDFYNSRIPSTSFISQVPEGGGKLSLEAYVIKRVSKDIEIEHKPVDDKYYSVITTPLYKEVYAGGLNGGPEGDIYSQALYSFEQAKKILEMEGLSFADIVRQWNYIENITKVTGDDTIKQNYQVFNDVRSQYYGVARFDNGYPSATGIGTSSGGVTLGFIAVSPGSISVHPLRNPGQTDAHRYSGKVLVGEGLSKETGKTTPKFERGKLLKANGGGRIYVSGTAAVVGEDSSHTGDVEKQTVITIDNIYKLLSPGNLSQYGITTDIRRKRFSYVRTYVKYPQDIDRVRKICEKHLDSEHYQYLISDICRDNLLVEIEGSVDI